MLRNSIERWGSVAKSLHWSLAGLIILQMGLGMAAIAWSISPAKLDLFVWHKSFGMLILLLVVARLAWRLTNPTPRLPAGPPWERWAARISHALLYVLMLLLPLSGWVIHSAANIPLNLFWLLPLSPITTPNETVEIVAKQLHLTLALALILVVAVHVAAALRHHVVLRDQILIRMLPFTRNRP